MNWRKYQSLQKVLKLGNRFMSYVDQGTGEPVVLLHGFPSWGYAWHRILARLAREHRVLVPDLLGYGFSDRRDCFDRSIAKQTTSTFLWMGLLGIERAHFVGHEIGGGVALRMATLFPARVASLTLIDSVCYDAWPIEPMIQFGNPRGARKLNSSTLLKQLKSLLKPAFAETPGDELLAPLALRNRSQKALVDPLRLLPGCWPYPGNHASTFFDPGSNEDPVGRSRSVSPHPSRPAIGLGHPWCAVREHGRNRALFDAGETGAGLRRDHETPPIAHDKRRTQ